MLEATRLLLNVSVESVVKGVIDLMDLAVPLASHLINFTVIKMVEEQLQRLVIINKRVISFSELLSNVSFFENVVKTFLRSKCEGDFAEEAGFYVEQFQRSLITMLGPKAEVLHAVLRKTALVCATAHAEMAKQIHTLFLNHHEVKPTYDRLCTFVKYKHGASFRVGFLYKAMLVPTKSSSSSSSKNDSDSKQEAKSKTIDVFARQLQIHRAAFDGAVAQKQQEPRKCESALISLIEKLGSHLHGRVVLNYMVMRYFYLTGQRNYSLSPITNSAGFRFGVYTAMIKDLQTSSKCHLL